MLRTSLATEFICYVAQRRGKLGKGGVPDKMSACRCILYDWNTGKIPFYTLPPADEEDMNAYEFDRRLYVLAMLQLSIHSAMN